MSSERSRSNALANFIAGAVIAGIALTVLLLIQGPEPFQILGVATPPTQPAGWWGLVALSAALGAATGAVGILVGWLLSRPRKTRGGRSDFGGV